MNHRKLLPFLFPTLPNEMVNSNQFMVLETNKKSLLNEIKVILSSSGDDVHETLITAIGLLGK